ncbi:MAG: SLBB domain-containing protein [Gemmatimonadota bacterium]
MKNCIPAIVAFSAVAGLWISPPAAVAQELPDLMQQAEELLGRPVDTEEALRLLQQSGVTPDQLRQRLVREGFSRAAADPYLAVLEGRADRVPAGTNPLPLFQVLTGVDLASQIAARQDSLQLADQFGPGVDPTVDSLPPEPPGPMVFGREMFRRFTNQFNPPRVGPVPASYRVGPEDELVVVLTGDVEVAYRLTVARDGWIVLPDVGRVAVTGLSLGALRRVLRGRLSTAYSGLTDGPDASTFLEVSLDNLRANQVYVIGEVERPGAYEVGGLATVLSALYRAAGPLRTGSFRNIRVNRGGRLAATVDLYEYLLGGDASADIRLEQGDIIFVPVAGRQVEIDGAVRRPGIYEIQPADGLNDLIRFAGGVAADAFVGSVQIERILPPEEREPGRHRALVNAAATGLTADGPGAELVDGDRITIFAVTEDRVSSVRISGGVWRPGAYAAEGDFHLSQLLERAGGLLPDAVLGRAQIQRMQPDRTRRMVSVSLELDAAGRLLTDPVIEPEDQVFVFAQRYLREERVVSIGGWVREPGVFPFVDGMSVRDLILRAGGLRTGAYLGAVDVSRVTIAQAYGDTITENFTIALDSTIVFDASRRSSGSRVRPGSGEDFELANLDAVYLRKAPGFEPQRRVIVTGEVMFPGPYSLQTRGERLTDLLQRAGGLTPEAYQGGLQLWRAEPNRSRDTLSAVAIAARAVGDTSSNLQRFREDQVGLQPDTLVNRTRQQELDQIARARSGSQAATDSIVAAARRREAAARTKRTRVGVDFRRALENPASSQNIVIEPADSIFVPSFIPTVDVGGAVEAPTKVLYRQGAGVGYYISRAGGYTSEADKGRTRVQLANGEVDTRGGKFLFFGGGIAKPDPGSTITVPKKRPKQGGGLSFAQLATIFTSLATATATIIIAAR